MSVPPLVSSTPPPPDECDDDDYNDYDDGELVFRYPDGDIDVGDVGDSPPKPSESPPPKDAPDFPCFSPNIEDLDLKLDEGEKGANEEGIDDSFDDFGTFLEPTEPEDRLRPPPIEPEADRDDTTEPRQNEDSFVSENSKPSSTGEEDSESLQNDDPFDADDFASSPMTTEEKEESKNDAFDVNQFDPEAISDHLQFEFSATFEPFEAHEIPTANDIDASEESHSPREPAIILDDDEFDDFADFQTGETEPVEETDNFESIQTSHSYSNNVIDANEDDDDFGDFDTYVPSNNDAEKIISQTCSQNDKSAFDQMCTNMESLFPDEDAVENDPEQECDLKTSLGENWTRLINYETEQSYLFPWNNSSSQKTLLKCLGIDSRNILFGSKWNSNMPRFAANLGVSPLQPIKQNPSADSSSERPSESTQIEPTPSREEPWESGTQYETGEFQASSYAESLLLDLEHLMATLDQMTSGQSAHFKISDLFTNACNERDDHLSIPHPGNNHQGNIEEKISQLGTLNLGRKINLPDTHIFTPTDSVTPWSHTIHYNDESLESFPDIVPNSCRNSHIDSIAPLDAEVKPQSNDLESLTIFDSKPTTDYISDLNKENTSRPIGGQYEEFDDFGDFQSASQESCSHRPVIKEDHLVLKPIQVSPVAPVVNWPSPGDVKTTLFDDFSQIKLDNFNDSNITFPSLTTPFEPQSFILKESKITSTVEANNNMSAISTIPMNFESNALSENKLHNDFFDLHEPITANNEASNDEFDDFQSVKFTPVQNVLSEPIITSNGYNHSNDSFSFGNLLEPTPFLHPNEEKKTSQQILQPLSLESYSHINWPDPGTNLQDLSKFNPINAIKTYNDSADTSSTNDDDWSDFVSIKSVNHDAAPKPNVGYSNNIALADDADDWSDFVCSVVPSKSSNELKTISQNIQNHSIFSTKMPVQGNSSVNVGTLPHLNYVSPKSSVNRNYATQFQNL